MVLLVFVMQLRIIDEARSMDVAKQEQGRGQQEREKKA